MRRPVIAGLLLLAACGPQTSGTLQGIVVDVTGDLTTVERFTVLVEGDELVFEPSADGDYDFPLPHLREHLRTGEPVLVGFDTVDGVRIATTLADG